MMRKVPGPPRLAASLLRCVLPREEARHLFEDFGEIYCDLAAAKGRFLARLWLWGQVALCVPRILHQHVYWSFQMLKNYLVIALRHVRKHTMYSAINIAGLAIGTACFILIGLFVRFEFNFDGFHEKAGRVYRVVQEIERNEERFLSAPTPLPMVPALRSEIPEIERASRICMRYSGLLSTGSRHLYQTISYMDPEIFDIFSLPLVKGDPAAALSVPFSLVLSRAASEKFFGPEDPMGRTLTLNNRDEYTVTGVMEDYPDNSHVRLDVLGSVSSLEKEEGTRWTSWDHLSNDYTYVLLGAQVDPADLENRLQAFLGRHVKKSQAEKNRLRLMPLLDAHFTEMEHDIARTYSRTLLYAMSAIGFFILLIACINFMNLATARSMGRAREVGLRKVVGARRAQLIRQFLTESLTMAGLATVGAVGLVGLVLPWFRGFIGRQIGFPLLSDPTMPILLAGLGLVIGLASGSYPALMLSAFRPIRTLRGKPVWSGVRRFSFRTVFVVLQFAISIILIVATLVVYRQLHFLRGRDLGFKGDQVLMIPLQKSPLRQRAEAFKMRLEQHPLIESVSVASGTPGSGSSQTSNFDVETPDGEKEIYISYIRNDYDYVKTFGMTLVDGRDFSRGFTADEREAVIINQTTARAMGWDSPIGRTIKRGGDERMKRVIGVVKDFHYHSAHSRISPMALMIDTSDPSFIAMRVSPANVERLIPDLEKAWVEEAPRFPFEYFFADRKFERSYRFDRKVGELFTAFAGLAILISCLGVFGLISFTAEQATKEIGIRKVLGANPAGIVIRLSGQFARWVLIANLIAWPVAWYAMGRWLQGFVYRISLGPVEFLTAGLLALLTALATVFHQALKAALADPAQSLRHE